jgi:hypothetical protein
MVDGLGRDGFTSVLDPSVLTSMSLATRRVELGRVADADPASQI